MAGKKILVADDSLTIQKVIRLSLTHEGYDIQAVSDGNDALERIAVLRPEVVLIDVSLPGKSAFEVKREINSHEDLKGLEFVLMSGAYEKVDDAQVTELGFHTKLTKPIDPAELRKILNKILGKTSSSAQVSSQTSTPSMPPSPPPSAQTPEEEPPSSPADSFNLDPPLLPPLAEGEEGEPSPPSLLPQGEMNDLPPAEVPSLIIPPQGAPGEEDLLNDLHLELPPELNLDLGSSELPPPSNLPPQLPSLEGLNLPPPPASLSANDGLETPVQPEEPPPLPSPSTEAVEELWEAKEEKTLSGLMLDADLSLQAPPQTPRQPSAPSTGIINPSAFTPPATTPEASSPASKINPENDEWSVRDAQHSPKAQPPKAQFKSETPPILPTSLPEELQAPPLKIKSASTSTHPSPSNLKIEELLKDTPPLPISTEEIESLVKQQIQSAIERITQQMLPDIAERVVKQEIHRLLSEPQGK
jgi:CheY-like chemotaxis protein